MSIGALPSVHAISTLSISIGYCYRCEIRLGQRHDLQSTSIIADAAQAAERHGRAAGEAVPQH